MNYFQPITSAGYLKCSANRSRLIIPTWSCGPEVRESFAILCINGTVSSQRIDRWIYPTFWRVSRDARADNESKVPRVAPARL